MIINHHIWCIQFQTNQYKSHMFSKGDPNTKSQNHHKWAILLPVNQHRYPKLAISLPIEHGDFPWLWLCSISPGFVQVDLEISCTCFLFSAGFLFLTRDGKNDNIKLSWNHQSVIGEVPQWADAWWCKFSKNQTEKVSTASTDLCTVPVHLSDVGRISSIRSKSPLFLVRSEFHQPVNTDIHQVKSTINRYLVGGFKPSEKYNWHYHSRYMET